MENHRKRIGIMGGTFDPIHVGHLILGEKAYEQFHLDKVWFMPSGNPPHKKNRVGRASDEQRVEMVRRAISGNPHFELSLEEMNEEGYSYTFRTLENLKQQNPETDYYFIIGADSLYNFETWKEPDRICRCCILVVAARSYSSSVSLKEEMLFLSRKYNGKFLKMDTMSMDVSSELIRKWLAEGKSIRYYVPDQVVQYISENQIYRSEKKEVASDGTI